MVLLAFSGLVTGCGALAKLQKPGDKDVYFEGKSQITITSPEMTANFSAQIQFTLNDSFHIGVKGPFGINAGDVFIIQNRFVYINKLERIVLSGENNDGLLESVFQIPVHPGILSKLVLLPHLIKQHHLQEKQYDRFTAVTFNNKNLVTSAKLVNPEGEISFKFDQFHKESNIYFPYKILLEHETSRQYLQLSFNKIEKVNKQFPELPVIDNSYQQL